MVNPIPERAKLIWEHWNIRGAVLLSLLLQMILILFAPVRKRTSNKAIMLLIWSAYLLADAVANFAIGLIFNSQGNPPSSSHTRQNADLLAMWAPFLLVHLGGPDTITAFSLEDNQLWLRHLLSFVVQAATTGYVFVQTLPRSKLIAPTLLLFVSGFIKYLERTCSLYMASKEKFRDSLLRKPEPGEDYAGLVDVYGLRLPDPGRLVTRQPSSVVRANVAASDAEMGLVLRAYRCFDRLRGLIVNLPVRAAEYEGIHVMWEDTESESERALRMIEMELNFFYEVLYTKASVVHSRLGSLCRSVSLVSVVSASTSSSSATLPLSHLEALDIDSINDIVSFPEDAFQNLKSLKTFRVSRCRRLKTLFEAICHLMSLTTLSIEACPKLDPCSGDDGTLRRVLENLHSVTFDRIPELVSLPCWIQHLPLLERLEISGCHNLHSFPEWMTKRALRVLIIIWCPQLTAKYQRDVGEDWHTIKHIPGIIVNRKAV